MLPRSPTLVIVGSGFGGLCLGTKLKAAGIGDFTILEKEDDLGGTWRDNVYPGAACDIASFQYCFSFEQKTDWSRKWAPQEEILGYMRGLAAKHDLLRHIRFGSEVTSARFDEARAEWVVRTKGGDEHRADFLVSAVGQLNKPQLPKVRGLETFSGVSFHSARWRKDVDLTGKVVAVVGNAASAVQFVPEIAKIVKELRVFQRSANWMVPKEDRAYTDFEKALFERVPFLARLYRWRLWLMQESMFPVFRSNRFLSELARKEATEHLEAQVKDPALRAKLLPDYPIGAKRILISDEYYPALQRANVLLVTDAIQHIEPRGIVTADGTHHDVDVIIFATGFDSTSFLAPMHIEGRGGRTLKDAWRDGAEAYLGITVAGFPNFFVMYGPNTNLGHNSILFMLECQTRYILGSIRQMVERGLGSAEPSTEAMRTYNERVQAKLAETVWSKIDASWYKTTTGRITNNWYGSTLSYWRATRRPDLSVYRVEPARPERAEAPTAARPT